MENKVEELLKKTIQIACALILLAITLLTFRAIMFTFFTYDDFGHAATAGSVHATFLEHLLKSIEFDRYIYNTHQGTFFTMFIQIFLCPLSFKCSDEFLVLHIEFAITFVLVYFTLYLLLSKLLTKFFYLSRTLSLVVFTVLVSTLMNFNEYEEAFFLFSGITAYTIPCITMFLAFWIITRRKDESSKTGVLYAILANVLFFLTAGGSLQIACTMDYLLLCAIIVEFLSKNIKGKISLIINFIVAVVGTAINAFAPGNFIRYEMVDDGPMKIFPAVGWAGFHLFDEFDKLFNNTMLGTAIVICIFVGITIGKKAEGEINKKYLIYSVLFCLTPFCTVYPVVLGYGGIGLPNRALFIFHLSMVAVVLNIAMVFGFILGKELLKLGIKTSSKLLVMLCIMISVVLLSTDNVCFRRLSEKAYLYRAAQAQIYTQVTEGKFSGYYLAIRDIIDEIKQSDDSDVNVQTVLPETPEYMVVFEQWDYIARYYGKNSVNIEVEE